MHLSVSGVTLSIAFSINPFIGGVMRIVGFGALLLLAVVFAGSDTVLADQAGDDSSTSNSPTTLNPTTRQNDPRLPPVMPGEEIVTQTGQKMRVWSSAGPVPVNPQPTPQQLNNG